MHLCEIFFKVAMLARGNISIGVHKVSKKLSCISCELSIFSVFCSSYVLLFSCSKNLLNCSLFNPNNLIKYTDIFTKIALEDIGGNTGGVVENVENYGFYGA